MSRDRFFPVPRLLNFCIMTNRLEINFERCDILNFVIITGWFYSFEYLCVDVSLSALERKAVQYIKTKIHGLRIKLHICQSLATHMESIYIQITT